MNHAGWGVVALVTGSAAMFLLAYVLLDAAFGRTPLQRRLTSLHLFTAVEAAPSEPAVRRLLRAGGRRVEQSTALHRVAGRSATALDQLGSRIRPGEWLVVRAGVAVLAALLLGTLLPAWLGVPTGLVLGFRLPDAVLRSAIRRRRQQFADDLPGVLHLMLSSLRSGFTLQQAVEAAVRDDEGPVAEELSRALSETRISGGFEDALHRAGERVGSQETVWLVMAIRLQREVGGSLAEVMQITADTMRERAHLRRHVRTLSAEGRISGYVLMALPVGTALTLAVMRPEYVRPLYTEIAGIAMLVLALLLLMAGSVWLRSATRIEI